MTTYGEQVRETFRDLETEELLDRVKGETLTAEAHQMALDELASRGVEKVDLPPQPVFREQATQAPGFLRRCWSGKEPLWRAFWLLGLSVAVVAIPLNLIKSPILLFGYFFAAALPAQIFWWVSVWRCAFRTSHWLWGVIARAWVGVSILIACLMVLAPRA